MTGISPFSLVTCLLLHTLVCLCSHVPPSLAFNEIIPHVNGYVRLTFSPVYLDVPIGTQRTGYVNVSIDEDVSMPDKLLVIPCCFNTGVATVQDRPPVPVRNNSQFSLSVHGSELGRTKVKFIVYKNIPKYRVPPDITESTSLVNTSDIWWMAYDYDVIVKNSPRVASFYLSAVVLGLMALNLVGVGGQLDGEEIVHLIKKPLAISVGIVCRFGVMPALGLGIIELLQPERNTSLGVLSLICSPAEGASNLLIMLAESDLTFSVTLTSVNNFAAVGMLPLWTILFETRIYNTPGSIAIPFKEAFIIFFYIVIALSVGFLMHRKLSNMYHNLWTYLPSVTIITLLLAVSVEIYNSSFIFACVTKEILCACLMLACCGYVFGAVLAFIAQQPHKRILVTSVETGARTTFITGLLLDKSLAQPEADMAKTAPVLCTLLALVPAIIVVIIFRVYRRYTGKDYAENSAYEGSEEEVTDCMSDKEVVAETETCM